MWSRRYFVRVTKREKRACRRCSSVTAAPLAERIIEKGLASDAGVINAILAKYCDYVPLYRQAVMLEREAGVEIGRATLDGWVMRVGELRVGELLQPVVGAMRRDLVKASYLQADETPVPVQMHDRRGEIIKRTCGNTASRAARRCSIFVWAAVAMDRGNFWASGKEFWKPTGIRSTKTSAGRSWCMWAAGRTRGASSSTR
jgi:transposase